MKLRAVLILLGVLVAGIAAWAALTVSRPGRPLVIAIMPSFTTTSGPAALRFAVLRRLVELGWVQGVNIDWENHVAANETRAVTELMSGLARRRIDVVLVLTLQMAFAVRSVLPDVPIVVAAAPDPVRSGAAESLAHPGGTITGVSLMSPELATKRVQQLIEFRPQARRIAILHNPDSGPEIPVMLESASNAASARGVQARVFALSTADAIDPVFDAIAEWNADGVIVLDDAFFFIERAGLAAAAQRRTLPLACPFSEMARAGCLFSYSGSAMERLVRSVEYIDRILRGAKPGDLPFDQPTRFELVINLKTARALGIAVPAPLLSTADEVIE